MRSLIARNVALRTAPVWMLVMLVGAQVVTGIYGYRVAKGAEMTNTTLLAGAWLMIAAYLTWGQVKHRCSRFDLALPLPARSLWTASLIGSSLAVALMVATILAVVAAIFALAESLEDYDALRGGEIARVGAILLSASLCGVAWLHNRQPELASATGGPGRSALALGGLLALLPPMILLQDQPLLLVPLLLALAALLLAAARRGVPPGYVLSPLSTTGAAGRAGPDTIEARPARGPRAVWLIYMMVVRSAPKGPAILLLATPFLLFFGTLLAGLLQRLMPDSDLRFAFLPMTAYMALAFVAPVMANLRAVDVLPLGRRRLLLLMTLPPLLLITAGYLGTVVWIDTQESEMPRIVYVEEEENYGLRVPRFMWRMAWDGEVPPAEAPWGESHPAMTIPVIEGAVPVLYKPYTTPAGASRDYVAWQIRRAALASFGTELTREEIAERYLWTDPDGRVRLKDEGLDLPGPGWALVDRSLGPFLPVTLALVAALMYVGIAIYAPGVRAGVTRMRRYLRLWAVLGLLLLIHMAPFVLAIAGLSKPWILEAAGVDVMMKLARAVPGGIAGVWIAAVVVGAAFFELAATAFRRVESPVAPDTYFWTNLGKGD